jgi:hypothetical protein
MFKVKTVTGYELRAASREHWPLIIDYLSFEL